MSKNIERSGVYVDARALYKELYSNAFFKMSKTHRILMGDRMLVMCERLIADIAMAYNITDDKQKYIEKAVAQFEALKEILRLGAELSIIGDDNVKLRGMISENWFDFVHFNKDKVTVEPNEGFTYKERLIKKYNLKIKNHGSKKLQNKTEAA